MDRIPNSNLTICNMKFLVCFLAVIAAASASKEDILKQLIQEINSAKPGCIAESGGTAEDFAMMMKNQIPTSHNGKCLLFCLHKHFKIQNDDGSPNVQEALKSFEFVKSEPSLYAVFEKIADVCKSVAVAADPCDTAVTMGQCALAESKKAGFGAEMFDMEIM